MKDPTRPADKPVLVTDEEGNALPEEGISGGAGVGQNNQTGFPSVKLSAIVVTEPVKYAIINNEVVYEGQSWRNVLLSQVKPYSIIIKLNDLEKEITISKTDFITESNYEN
ncbi:hypothetical protein [Planctobacterium marinum]